jgi:3-hydroxyisobutyrate dehydrogenase-like beta-hydroxyacid dehydrogenase
MSLAVAVVGTGRMGSAMAARLHGAGHRLTVHNRTTARAAEWAERLGTVPATSPAQAVADADIVVVSLADDAALRSSYLGPDGIVAGLRPGAVVLDTSTVDPDTIRDLFPLVAGAGASLLDSPVSGSVMLCERGELTALVGGSAVALDTARPALETFAGRVFHVGESGAGATIKLAVNAVLHGLNQALAEALVLAEQAGVQRAAAYEVFAASAAGAPFVQYKRDAYLRPDETPVAFALDLVAKDLRLIATLAQRVGARMDQAATNAAVVADARAAGLGDQDMSALAHLLRPAPPT